jgi:hypothetical protein
MQENESIEIEVRQKRWSSEQITELVREFRSSGLNATEVLRTAWDRVERVAAQSENRTTAEQQCAQTDWIGS